jgi:hypothetical protein
VGDIRIEFRDDVQSIGDRTKSVHLRHREIIESMQACRGRSPASASCAFQAVGLMAEELCGGRCSDTL